MLGIFRHKASVCLKEADKLHIMTTEAYRPGPCGGSAANNHVEIDLPTGLPKLSIELLPEEEKPQRKHPPLLDYIHRLPVGLHVSPAEMAARVSAVRVQFKRAYM